MPVESMVILIILCICLGFCCVTLYFHYTNKHKIFADTLRICVVLTIVIVACWLVIWLESLKQ